MSHPEFVRALYPYLSEDHAKSLEFPASAVLMVIERADDGWCRGYANGKQGWFPGSYTKTLGQDQLVKNGVDPEHFAVLFRSPDWKVYADEQDRLYFVNAVTQETSWQMPVIASPLATQANRQVPSEMANSGASNGGVLLKRQLSTKEKHKKPKYLTSGGLTFLVDGGEPQELLSQGCPSYIDYFWADKGDQTGFGVILEKHLNGKFAMKDMVEFFHERALIEEQYARNLAKLSRSTLGEQEEGTLKKAWLAIKSEVRFRSEAHNKFASKINEELEKKIMEYKESQKATRKEHEAIMEKARKQVQSLDASIEKMKNHTKESKIGKRRSTSSDTKGEELRKIEMTYNQAQRLFVDSMIAACRDFERHEDERSDFLKDRFLKYIDLCVEIHEACAESLTRTTDMIDVINRKADREFFIKQRQTGSLRPVDRPLYL